MSHQRTVYHPTREELLDVVRDSGEAADYYDSLGNLADDPEENCFARLLGYDPEREGEHYA